MKTNKLFTLLSSVIILSLLIILPISNSANKKNSVLQKEIATLAGGCFWCMEPPFEKLTGVISVISGYAGGKALNPTYNDYAKKGYVEVVQITFDPTKISYDQLLDVFWRQINPTDAKGQFVDRGAEYRSAIFYHTKTQRRIALKSKSALAKSGRFKKPLVTEIIPFTNFYPAEEYHQDFYKKNPDHYYKYRSGSGRDSFIEKNWGRKK